eukprot:6882967-Heterocapsa_arctica.AAC.1
MHPIESAGKKVNKFVRIGKEEHDLQHKEGNTKWNTDSPSQGTGDIGNVDYEVQANLGERNKPHHKMIFKDEKNEVRSLPVSTCPARRRISNTCWITVKIMSCSFRNTGD